MIDEKKLIALIAKGVAEGLGGEGLARAVANGVKSAYTEMGLYEPATKTPKGKTGKVEPEVEEKDEEDEEEETPKERKARLARERRAKKKAEKEAAEKAKKEEEEEDDDDEDIDDLDDEEEEDDDDDEDEMTREELNKQIKKISGGDLGFAKNVLNRKFKKKRFSDLEPSKFEAYLKQLKKAMSEDED